MEKLIKNISKLLFIFLMIITFSCRNISIVNNNQIKNKDDIYKIVDSINNLSDKFSKENIYIMGNLYRKSILQKMIDTDAYTEVDDYFLDLFYKKNKSFYTYLSELNDTIILSSIKRVISQHFDLYKDYDDSFESSKDSIYLNHLKNNINKKSIVDEIFGYGNKVNGPKNDN